MGFFSVLNYAHQLVERTVQKNDIVIDATVGKGADTLFLAKCVGAQGKVYGFDIQQKALQIAQSSIEESSIKFSNICLIHQSHANMLQHIPHKEHGHVSVVMFNLGYLPSCNHNIVTQADTTLQALEASIQLIKNGGMITIILYTGHVGGQAESDAVLSWSEHLPQKSFDVLKYEFVNQINHPPFLLAIKKRS